jgi:PAS domain S-box-containing protein
MDITERKKVYDELIKSEKKYKYFYDNALEMLKSVDNSGRIIDVNQRLMKLSGYTKKDLVGKSITKFIPLKHLPLVMKMFSMEKKGVKTPSSEIEVRTKDGRLVPIELSAGAIKLFDDKGKQMASRCLP